MMENTEFCELVTENTDFFELVTEIFGVGDGEYVFFFELVGENTELSW